MNTRQIRLSRTLSAIVVAIVIGLSDRAAAQCATSADCKVGRACERGQCVDAASPVISQNQMACDAGDARACAVLGVMNENGDGVSKDQDRALELYERACAGGYAWGCQQLPRVAACTKDLDCKGDRVCSNGLCVHPRTAAFSSPTPVPVALPPPAAAAPPVDATNPSPTAGTSNTSGDDTVPVDISGPEGYVIRSTNRSGVTVECVSPCTLRLSPGPATLHVVGYFDETVQVPNHATSAVLSRRRMGLIVTGAIIAPLGLTSGIVAYATWHTLFGDQIQKNYAGVSFLASAAGFALLTGALIGTHNGIAIDDRRAATSPWSSVALGVEPRPGGGFLVAGTLF
jgi:hypothetical protein